MGHPLVHLEEVFLLVSRVFDSRRMHPTTQILRKIGNRQITAFGLGLKVVTRSQSPLSKEHALHKMIMQTLIWFIEFKGIGLPELHLSRSRSFLQPGAGIPQFPI